MNLYALPEAPRASNATDETEGGCRTYTPQINGHCCSALSVHSIRAAARVTRTLLERGCRISWSTDTGEGSLSPTQERDLALEIARLG